MVLLTVTPGIYDALASLTPDALAALQTPTEPILACTQPGHPISHRQLIHLAKAQPEPLAILLRNTSVYVPPPPPKPEPTPEFKALMARLRAEEEAASYERMLHPPPTRESFSQRFPRADFSLGTGADAGDEDVSFEEVHRQIILIINVLVSIVCVAVFIWVAARHWTVGKRLGLSMGGSLAVAIAEVAVYSGYVRKVREAKQREKKKPEIKEIVQSWVLDRGVGKDTSLATGAKETAEDGIRYRKGKHR